MGDRVGVGTGGVWVGDRVGVGTGGVGGGGEVGCVGMWMGAGVGLVAELGRLGAGSASGGSSV